MNCEGEDAYDTRRLSTQHEMDFVRRLGEHCASGYRKAGVVADRLSLLTGYLQSMARREEWDLIDQNKVRAEVLELIANETKHRAAFVPTNGHGIVGARQYAKRASHRGGAE